MNKMSNPLEPTATVLIKLGSLAVHIEEYLSPKGHPVDRAAIETLLNDEEVKNWLIEMNKLAFLPVKR